MRIDFTIPIWIVAYVVGLYLLFGLCFFVPFIIAVRMTTEGAWQEKRWYRRHVRWWSIPLFMVIWPLVVPKVLQDVHYVINHPRNKKS